MKRKFTTYLNDVEITVIASVSPAVPPRPCSNPDDPAFSDPGDPGESQVEAVLLHKDGYGHLNIADYLPDDVLEALAQEALDEVADQE